MSKTKYRGIETTFNDNLLEKSRVKKCNPVLSRRFRDPSLYYDGMYYFFDNISETSDGRYSIEAVYYSGKWRQERQYITEHFRNFLLKFAPKTGE